MIAIDTFLYPVFYTNILTMVASVKKSIVQVFMLINNMAQKTLNFAKITSSFSSNVVVALQYKCLLQDLIHLLITARSSCFPSFVSNFVIPEEQYKAAFEYCTV